MRPVGGTHLHIAAFDLARGRLATGGSCRSALQAPSEPGLPAREPTHHLAPVSTGLRVHARAAAGRHLPRAGHDNLKARSLTGITRTSRCSRPAPTANLFRACLPGALPGPDPGRGSDLTVRDQHLYLKTSRNWSPSMALLKRLDDQFLDPLELRRTPPSACPGCRPFGPA